MTSITAEVTFMVYSQNGVGRPEKRILELTHQDYIACSSSNRDKNEQLKSWGKMMFPTAKDVRIQGAKRIYPEKTKAREVNKSKNLKSKTANSSGSSFGCMAILLFPFKLIIWFFKFALKN